MLAGQRCNRLAESEHQRHRQNQVDQQAQEQHPVRQPASAGARKEDEGQQAIKKDDDQHQAEGGFEDGVDAPGAVAKHGETDDHGDGCRDQLRQNGHGERGARARHSEPRLHDLLEGVDVVLEFAREEFANLLVETVDVGDQRQQAEQERESYADTDHCWCFLPARGAVALSLVALSLVILSLVILSMSPSGRWSFARNCFSRRAIPPLSHS